MILQAVRSDLSALSQKWVLSTPGCGPDLFQPLPPKYKAKQKTIQHNRKLDWALVSVNQVKNAKEQLPKEMKNAAVVNTDDR